jgi:hypothetical protein
MLQTKCLKNRHTAADVALLAPVPSDHLTSGKSTCEAKGRVAFGSRAREVFLQLDELRAGLPVDVYIYASHADGQTEAAVSWHARYVGHVESKAGVHPHSTQYRPVSTVSDTKDSEIFWEVEHLGPLPQGKHKPVSALGGYASDKTYSSSFRPRRPLLIKHP